MRYCSKYSAPWTSQLYQQAWHYRDHKKKLAHCAIVNTLAKNIFQSYEKKIASNNNVIYESNAFYLHTQF